MVGATLKRTLEGVFSVPGATNTLNEAVEGGTRGSFSRLLVWRRMVEMAAGRAVGNLDGAEGRRGRGTYSAI